LNNSFQIHWPAVDIANIMLAQVGAFKLDHNPDRRSTGRASGEKQHLLRQQPFSVGVTTSPSR
jgi:hypothetical protein